MYNVLRYVLVQADFTHILQCHTTSWSSVKIFHVMACWLIINKILHYSLKGNSTGNYHESNQYNASEDKIYRIKPTSTRGQLVIKTNTKWITSQPHAYIKRCIVRTLRWPGVTVHRSSHDYHFSAAHVSCQGKYHLTHLPLDKMAAHRRRHFQTHFRKRKIFRLKDHWNLFLRAQLIFGHWFR